MIERLGMGVDWGLVALIWIVQLVVYPSFRHIDAEAFKAWHGSYTRRIGVIVAPLMIAQLVLHGYGLWLRQGFHEAASLGLVVSTWIVTGASAVPLHRRLESGGKQPSVIERLLRVNAVRTGLWTLVALLSLFPF